MSTMLVVVMTITVLAPLRTCPWMELMHGAMSSSSDTMVMAADHSCCPDANVVKPSVSGALFIKPNALEYSSTDQALHDQPVTAKMSYSDIVKTLEKNVESNHDHASCDCCDCGFMATGDDHFVVMISSSAKNNEFAANYPVSYTFSMAFEARNSTSLTYSVEPPTLSTPLYIRHLSLLN